ncbi:MAG: hypothetical protein AAB250_02140 [Bdellovibrionota bacterium]
MKQVLMTLIGVLVCASAFATSMEEARAVKEKIKPALSAMQGVAGIGLAYCDAETGAESTAAKEVVACVAIRTQTELAEQALLALYPRGSQVEGVYLSIRYVGRVVIHPRMSGGN